MIVDLYYNLQNPNTLTESSLITLVRVHRNTKDILHFGLPGSNFVT